jgi:phosphatidylserine/phosphatidylglycerophosphate/cardiolipin synthase-like enzyme
MAEALEARRLKPPYTALAVAEWAPQPARKSLADELTALEGKGFQPIPLAITLKALAEERAARQRERDQIRLVWTTPDQEGPSVRDTSVVVRQLLSEARESIWVSTFNVFDGADVFLPIYEAWSGRPVLSVVIIVNVGPDEDRGIYDAAALAKYVRSFWKYHWPWSLRPRVYYYPRGALQDKATRACQHAKCILVDGKTAFITSANFTESAQERNIELGVMFRENPLMAQSIQTSFEGLIQKGLLVALPTG